MEYVNLKWEQKKVGMKNIGMNSTKEVTEFEVLWEKEKTLLTRENKRITIKRTGKNDWFLKIKVELKKRSRKSVEKYEERKCYHRTYSYI